MQSAFTIFENLVPVVFIIISLLSPFVLAVVAIDALTKKPKKNLSIKDLSMKMRQSVTALAALGTEDTRHNLFVSSLIICPGALIAVVGYLFVIGPWLPAIFTLPRGTGIRPMGWMMMGWMMMAWLICVVITYIGTPIAAFDILRGVFSVRRSRVSRVSGIVLGLVGVAAGIYASHLPYDVINGMAAWRGWVIEE